MTETARSNPYFLADDRALDLLNSVAAPRGAEIEWLSDGWDLLDWLGQAGLVPPEVLLRFREEASPGVLDGIAAEACELREWLREFVAAHAGRRLEPPDLADLDGINRLLARDQTYHQLEAQDIRLPGPPEEAHRSPLRWRRHRRWRTPEDLLLPIAEAVGDLICQADFARVKICEGPTCTMWFHDVSKNHTRRWCTMAVCGNRAKAAAHRARQRRARSSRRP